MRPDEMFIQFRFRTRELAESITALRPAWNDQAARDIHARYLGPLENEERRLSQALNGQEQALNEAQRHLVAADGHGTRARSFEDQLHRHVEYANEERRHTERAIAQFTRADKTAHEELLEVRRLIEQANSTCG